MRGHFNHEAAMKEIAENVKNSAYEIIEKKGATYYGIAMSVRRICEAIVRDEKTILPVSSLQHDNHGISDVALSMPAIVGKDGVESTVPISLNNTETEALKASAATLKKGNRGRAVKGRSLDELFTIIRINAIILGLSGKDLLISRIKGIRFNYYAITEFFKTIISMGVCNNCSIFCCKYDLFRL